MPRLRLLDDLVPRSLHKPGLHAIVQLILVLHPVDDVAALRMLQDIADAHQLAEQIPVSTCQRRYADEAVGALHHPHRPGVAASLVLKADHALHQPRRDDHRRGDCLRRQIDELGRPALPDVPQPDQRRDESEETGNPGRDPAAGAERLAVGIAEQVHPAAERVDPEIGRRVVRVGAIGRERRDQDAGRLPFEAWPYLRWRQPEHGQRHLALHEHHVRALAELASRLDRELLSWPNTDRGLPTR